MKWPGRILTYWRLFVVLFPRSAASTRESTDACAQLQEHHAKLLVSFPGDDQYTQDIRHPTPYTSEEATCSVQPRNEAEIQSIFEIIRNTRSNFAIKGCGHANNPGHSSTPGVQVSLSRFNHLQYDLHTQTLSVGPGITWDEVYEKLEPIGRMAVGGRIHGVGVGGFLLGGGFSYKTNQFGLGSDNVLAYTLVTPMGQILEVDAESHPDIYWGLRGGLNNLGIVTSFKLLTHPQTSVYAGTLTYPGVSPQFLQSFLAFDTNTKDPKASAMGILMYTGGQITSILTGIYDAPQAPEGIFDDFLSIPGLVGTMKETSFFDFIKTSPSLPPGLRTLAHSVPLKRYPQELIDFLHSLVQNEAAAIQANSSCLLFAAAMESFQESAFVYDKTSSVYPHSEPNDAWTPFNLAIAWSDPADDEAIVSFMDGFASTLHQKAVQLGLSTESALIYPNYALGAVPLHRIYGAENTARLAELRRKVDPEDVMSLAGGFIVPLSAGDPLSHDRSEPRDEL